MLKGFDRLPRKGTLLKIHFEFVKCVFTLSLRKGFFVV